MQVGAEEVRQEVRCPNGNVCLLRELSVRFTIDGEVECRQGDTFAVGQVFGSEVVRQLNEVQNGTGVVELLQCFQRLCVSLVLRTPLQNLLIVAGGDARPAEEAVFHQEDCEGKQQC